MLKHKELDIYKELHSKFMLDILEYHNKQCVHVEQPTNRTTVNLRSQLRELRKLTKQMAIQLTATYNEERENFKTRKELIKQKGRSGDIYRERIREKIKTRETKSNK